MGRLLLLKTALGGGAAAPGAYNHFFVVPVLEADHNDEGASDHIREFVRIESAVLLAVVAVTAVLVGASS